jgi:hypothetical protein
MITHTQPQLHTSNGVRVKEKTKLSIYLSLITRLPEKNGLKIWQVPIFGNEVTNQNYILAFTAYPIMPCGTRNNL